MIRQFIAALCVSFCLPEMASTQQPGAYSLAFTGTGAYSLSHADLYSGFQNTAALASQKEPGLGVTGVRPYLLSSLSRYCFNAVFPVQTGTMGVKGNLRGIGGFTERQFGLSYARSLGAKLSAGLCFTYNSIRIEGYGQAGMPGVEAGLLLHVNSEVHAGLQLINPVSGKWGIEKSEKLPAVYVFGLGYETSTVFYCGIEITKEEEQPVAVSVNLQYKPVSRVLLRAGMGTGTSVTWAGAGFQLRRCRLDLFVSFHPQLGITPGAGFLFHFKKRKI